MCGGLINNILGLGGGSGRAPASSVAPTGGSAQVKQTTEADVVRQSGGTVVPQESRKGRLAGLGL